MMGVSWSPSGLPPFMTSRDKIAWDNVDDRKFHARIVAISTMPATHWRFCASYKPPSTSRLGGVPWSKMMTSEYTIRSPWNWLWSVHFLRQADWEAWHISCMPSKRGRWEGFLQATSWEWLQRLVSARCFYTKRDIPESKELWIHIPRRIHSTCFTRIMESSRSNPMEYLLVNCWRKQATSSAGKARLYEASESTHIEFS